MNPNDAALNSLREAVRVSPDNIPLRRHLAQTLSSLARYDEAEEELRALLKLAPDNHEVLLDLADAYTAQGKGSQAMVIVEDLAGRRDAPAAAHVHYARLLFRSGDTANAVAQYKLGIEKDEDAADQELAQQLGVVDEEDAGERFEGRVRETEGPGGDDFDAELERPKIDFKDVGGMESVKDEIRMKIIHPLAHPELYQAYGKKIGGGILMYGPPGCGKTHLARATAGQINAAFISVGIEDVLEMWIGSSERNLHELFDQARRNKPCVLFFDEVDALGTRRSDVHGGTQRQVINQFLSEMDGIDHDNEGVLILAATNAPWHVDSAFRRPGRFDRVIFVPPPDLPGRAEVLRVLVHGKPVESLDFDRLAKKSEGFSGADLKAVVDLAIEAKLRDAMKTGVPTPMTTKDLLAAAKTQRPTTKEWFAAARNYALYSNQGGMYDDVLDYLKLGKS